MQWFPGVVNNLERIEGKFMMGNSGNCTFKRAEMSAFVFADSELFLDLIITPAIAARQLNAFYIF